MADNSISTTPAWRVQQYREGNDVRVIDVDPVKTPSTKDRVTLRSIPAVIQEDQDGSPADLRKRFEEVLYSDRALPADLRKLAEASLGKARREWPGSEVRELVSSGQLENRINLTIVGDGYTAEEKERFFQDAARIKDELFAASTFKSYLPLFNVHAVFVPSNQSGLSDGADVRDTALGLYRSPAGSKRGVMPGDYGAIDRAIELSPATDYPILIANDDFYGGLGGQYAITTRSEGSGAMVLRHELGHNFGNVGEEYDGGQVYDGANHSYSADVPWKAWVDGDVDAYEAKALVGDYPWQNLKDGPITFDFDIAPREDGQKSSIRIDGSFVGWETRDDVAFLLDGRPVDVQVDPTNDRGFFAVASDGIEAGRHELTLAEKVADGDNVLASIRVTEYAPGYDFSRDKVEAYPTFSTWGYQAGFRPTHESCLMRDMRSKEFCAVDKENMWHEFLQRVSLIDGLTVGSEDGKGRVVSLRTPALEGLDVKWYQVDADGNETEVWALAGKSHWNPSPCDHGKYRARVTFSTPEVRVYNEHFTTSRDVQL